VQERDPKLRLAARALARQDSGRKDHRAANEWRRSCRHLPAVSGGCVVRGRRCRTERESLLANMASVRSAGSLTTSDTLPPVAASAAAGTLRVGAWKPLHPWRQMMKIGRNAGTGKFTTVKKAQGDKKGSVVETIKRAPAKKPMKK